MSERLDGIADTAFVGPVREIDDGSDADYDRRNYAKGVIYARQKGTLPPYPSDQPCPLPWLLQRASPVSTNRAAPFIAKSTPELSRVMPAVPGG